MGLGLGVGLGLGLGLGVGVGLGLGLGFGLANPNPNPNPNQGHGFSSVDRNGAARARLAFENGEGGTHLLEVQNLTDLVAAGADGDGAPPLDFAFISACHSVGRDPAPRTRCT